MADDPGYQRFFSYISLFTFSMLMLVMSNNFLQLFFGWEAVGLVSYLLIGFWYTRPTAIFANLKAFIVNRVGDFGFILGIGLIVAYAGTLNYGEAFAKRQRARHAAVPGQRLAAHHRHLHLPVHRRDGQERAVPAPRLAARLDGGPDADLGADPRRDDGDGRHLHGRAHVAAVRALRHGALVRAGDRRDHGALHGLSRRHPERHQARRRLLDALAARLHDGGARRLGVLGRGVPPDDARLLQGAALPRRRLGDHRHAPRPGHPQHGRPAEVHADHLDHVAGRLARPDRHAVLRRLLLEGLDHRGGAREPPRRRRLRLLRGRCRRLRHGVLFVPDVLPGLPRPGALPRQAVPARGCTTPTHDAPRATATTRTRATPSPTRTPAMPTHGRRTSRPRSSRCRWCCSPFRRS